MKTAKLFTNGRSQAVRLPKECQFSGDDVYVRKFENMVILIPKDDPWALLIGSLDGFSDDYMESREQPRIQSRDTL
ncbi:MAG: antitoxin [Chitinispirillaceae bacterium]